MNTTPRIDRYNVEISNGRNTRTITVQIIEGYSTVADIPKIVHIRYPAAAIGRVTKIEPF